MHAVRTGFVRRRADHTALGRISVTTDDDRASAKLWPAKHLDGRDELIEVDVQHPRGHAGGYSSCRRAQRDSINATIPMSMPISSNAEANSFARS